MEFEIKTQPCPFCGHESCQFHWKHDSASIVCELCEAEGPPCRDVHEAISLWNKRTFFMTGASVTLPEQTVNLRHDYEENDMSRTGNVQKIANQMAWQEVQRYSEALADLVRQAAADNLTRDEFKRFMLNNFPGYTAMNVYAVNAMSHLKDEAT